ncbi:hypothetical protein Btru_003709 [Bulinus truncatus]|nr:hypothetical protein Btru_003709 [Bulinus truncatus]
MEVRLNIWSKMNIPEERLKIWNYSCLASSIPLYDTPPHVDYSYPASSIPLYDTPPHVDYSCLASSIPLYDTPPHVDYSCPASSIPLYDTPPHPTIDAGCRKLIQDPSKIRSDPSHDTPLFVSAQRNKHLRHTLTDVFHVTLKHQTDRCVSCDIQTYRLTDVFHVTLEHQTDRCVSCDIQTYRLTDVCHVTLEHQTDRSNGSLHSKPSSDRGIVESLDSSPESGGIKNSGVWAQGTLSVHPPYNPPLLVGGHKNQTFEFKH